MTATTSVRAARTVVVRGREIPVVLPGRRDPRLRVAVVLITVQVLGQTVLGFKLSIAQILVTIGVAAAIEVTVTLWRHHAVVWPASALLTGNSVALLLRTTGTQHGDWWSLNGIQWFVLAAALSLLSKYLIRPGSGHVFNPSNVGLVGVLLLVGAEEVFPQYLYWGPLGPAVLATVAVLVAGALWVLRPLGLLPMIAAFMVPFGVAVAVLAAGGGNYVATWATEPVTGWFYWSTIVLSPETMIFVFFMMSDPQTAPRSREGRILFGAATALFAVVLIAPQPTEFGVKLAILSSLTISCALVPLLERIGSRPRSTRLWTAISQPGDGHVPTASTVPRAARRPVVLAVAIIAVAAAVDTAALAGDEQLVLIERGLGGDGAAQ